ncbi:MAG: cyclic nucleotide-binding domain-containing protein [Actinomycetota bacterium]
MTDLDQRLRSHPLIATLSDEYITKLEECGAELVTFEPDALIAEEGKDADACYFIEEGDVALELFLGGSQTRTVQTVHGGEIVGWSWLVPPHRWSFDAMALTQVTALRIDAKQLRQAMESDRPLGYELMKRFCEVIVSRLNASRFRILDLYGVTPTEAPRRSAFSGGVHP